MAILLVFLLVLASFTVWPQIDLAISGMFYKSLDGFFLADQTLLLFFQGLAYYGARVLAVVLALFILFTVLKRRPLLNVDAKGWLFVFLGLLLAPALIGNLILKDHWGRARPREVVEFGGNANFSSALVPQIEDRKNSSFVSGDAAFGFYLTALAYLAPLRSEKKRFRHPSRLLFWGGVGMGALFGLTRILMGAHFLSDVLYAALFMLGALAALHAFMFGKKETFAYWREWFFKH